MDRWSRRLAHLYVSLVCVLCLLASLGGRAAAADNPVAEMGVLNQKALAAYRKGKATVARRLLLRALVLAEDGGITKDRVLARTYANLGVVHLVALRQQKEAITCFVHALQIAPNVQPQSGATNPRVRKAMQEARRQLKRTAAREADLLSAAPPEPAAEPIAAGKPKEDLGLAADPPAATATTEAPPEPEPARTLASASTDGEEPPGAGAGEGDAEVGGRAPAGARRASAGYFWVGLGVGSAVGGTTRRGLEHHTNRVVKAGPLSAGLLHLQPEVGYQLSPGVAVSLQGRHQYIRPSGGPDTTVVGPPPRTAHAALLCLYYRIWQGESLALLGTAAVGGGSGFRLKVPPRPEVMLASSDTVAGGPFVAGPGLALHLALGDSIVVSPSVRVLVGAPNLAGVAEGTLGARYAF
jgi:hypothetical protein